MCPAACAGERPGRERASPREGRSQGARPRVRVGGGELRVGDAAAAGGECPEVSVRGGRDPGRYAEHETQGGWMAAE